MSLTAPVAAKLRSLVAENRHAAFVLRHLGQRPRATPSVDIYRIRRECINGGYMIEAEEIIDVFESFQKLGLGKVTKLRLPAHSTFKWHEVMQEVAEVAFEGNPRKVSLPTDRSPNTPHSVTASVKGSQTHTIDLYAPLRGRLIHLQLPQDFNNQDATELSEYLKQLAASRS